MSDQVPETLGEWRKVAVALFSEKSRAVTFLDEKIKEQGEDEKVVANESQMLMLLAQLNFQE